MYNLKKTFIFLTIFVVYITYCLGQRAQKQLESNKKCVKDSDCTEFSICIGNTLNTTGLCTCLEEYIPLKNETHYKCLKVPITLSDPCEDHLPCQVAFSNYAICNSSNLCECSMNTHFHNGKCYESVKLNDICQFNSNCLLKSGEVAGCIDGRCKCGPLKHAYSDQNGESCERNVLLGENCTNHGECSLTENTRCVGVCRCTPGYTQNAGEARCLKITNMIGETCVDTFQCEQLEQTECFQGSCKCIRTYHDVNNICYKDVELGGLCDSDAECITSIEKKDVIHCEKNRCVCAKGYITNDKTCVNFATKIQSSLALLCMIWFINFFNS